MGSPRPKQKRLGEKLLRIRKELDISQDRMPERLGRPDLHPGRISEYEQNKREPSLLTLLGYAKLAGVHLEDIANDNVDLPDKVPGEVYHPLTPPDDSD
jgi:transcriptional regulator with XRE-family HTH domain